MASNERDCSMYKFHEWLQYLEHKKLEALQQSV